MKNKKDKELSKEEDKIEDSSQKRSSYSISRRKFLRNSSMAAAGLYFVPRHVLGGNGYVAPSDKLLVAAVGTGNQAWHDIQKINESDNAEIAYLCDVDDRQAKDSREKFPKAKYYKDWRELFDKEHKNFDAVLVGTPDHNHATIAFHAMQMGKHVYVEKPLTHDIWEARMLGQAAERYKVVTQMGDQGASGDGVRQLKEWYEAGIIGDVHTVKCWTNRPVWPQGIKWPDKSPSVPKGLDWDLWLGTADKRHYQEDVVPFNWRGWWDFGTGAIGDMACHIVGPVFKVVNLDYPTATSSSAATVYEDEFKEAYLPDSGPIASSTHINFKTKDGNDVDLGWMDGGIQPERPEELKPNETMGDEDDVGNGTIFEGTAGKMMCGVYGQYPKLLPTSLNDNIDVPKKYPRIDGGADAHQRQWVEACIAGYGEKEVDSPFEEYAAPLTEGILMANLSIRSLSLREEGQGDKGDPDLTDYEDVDYIGRDITLEWDAEEMEVTNFDEANQFVKRDYREGWPKIEF